MGTIEKIASTLTTPPLLERKEEAQSHVQKAIQQETVAQVRQAIEIPGIDLAGEKKALLALITNKKVHSGILPMMATAETRSYINKCPDLLARMFAEQNVNKAHMDRMYAKNQSILKNNPIWKSMPVESAYVAILMTYATYFHVLEDAFSIDISSPTDAAKIIFKLEQGTFAHLSFSSPTKVA